MKERTITLTRDFFGRYPQFNQLRTNIMEAYTIITETFSKGGKLLICGNGGSCADSDHIVGELMKGFMLKRPLPKKTLLAFKEQFGDEGLELSEKLQGGLPTISLNAHASLATAFANDCDPTLIYAQQVMAYAKHGDTVLGISTSGNAENVRAALMAARIKNAHTLVLTGRDGGKIASLADYIIIVPENETYRIQECHLAIYHYLCAAVESELFEN